MSIVVFPSCLNGLQTGSVYALVALGYSMVYGIILLLNFAHGDIIMIGAYTAYLRHDRVPPASDRLRCSWRSCGEHAARRGDRKGRLYAASLGAASVAC